MPATYAHLRLGREILPRLQGPLRKASDAFYLPATEQELLQALRDMKRYSALLHPRLKGQRILTRAPLEGLFRLTFNGSLTESEDVIL